MILKFKAEKVSITIERGISVRPNPALSYQTDNYELTLDVEQLIGGFGDIVKAGLALHNQLNKMASKDELDIPEMSEHEFAQRKYKDDLAATLEAGRNNGQG